MSARTFVETMLEALAADPTGALLVEMHAAEERPLANRAALEIVARARGVLRARGIKKGDRVVLLAPNSARWALVDLALLAEGAIVVPQYVRQAPQELVDIARDAGAALAIVEGADLAKELVSAGIAVIAVDELCGVAGDGARAPGPVTGPPVALSDGDAATIIYTSGTSGVAKGVVLSRAGIEFMLGATSGALARMMGPSAGPDRVFHYLPFCFAGSRIVLWTCLTRRTPIRMSTNLDALKDELAGAAPHYFLNVPVLLERIKNGVEEKLRARGAFIAGLHRSGMAAADRIDDGRARVGDAARVALARSVIWKKVRAQIGRNLRCLICGSAPLGPETQRWFERIGIPVYQVYGLTETTAIVSMDEPGRVKPGRVGHVLPGVEMRVAEDHELLVRGPNVFGAYWNRPDETAAAFVDGWFRTGDAVEIDADGNLRIVGRTKNILVPSSGHNVAPEPIEEAVRERVRGAEHVVVIGHGRPFLTAIVAGKVEQAALDAAVDVINASLPHYRRIRKVHVTGEAFSPESGLLTANQKLRRRAVEERFAREIGAMYS